MAGTDSQRQLLTLIRNFATEKSQGERRVVALKKRIEELESEVDAANTELEEAKHFKETTEQELKGYELQFAFTDASIQTLEGRISSIQDEISSVGSEVDGLKNEENASRDEFIWRMFELNAKIRKFQEMVELKSQKDSSFGNTAVDTKLDVKKVVTGVDLKALEDALAHIVSQTTKEEQEYLAEQNFQKQVQKEYLDFQKKVSLMELIMNETKALQELTRQTSDLEQTCTSLGEELQKRCACPSCHVDNVEALGGILQANEAN